MSDDQGTFDFGEGERRKEEGMFWAAVTRPQLLERARELARAIASAWGEVTADDVWLALEREGLDPGLLGNAAGSVFRSDFEFTGRWSKSARVTNHARVNRVWRLKKPVASASAYNPGRKSA